MDRSDAWHQSTLNSLLDGCSWQYFLEYVLRVDAPSTGASLAGSAYHAALEVRENARLEGGAPVGQREMEDVAVQFVAMKGGTREQGQEAACAVRNFFRPMKDGSLSHAEWLDTLTPVAVEAYLRADLVDSAMPIAGTTDGIYRDSTGKILMVDHKSAMDLGKWKADSDDIRKQATLYAVAMVLSPEWDVSELPEMWYLVSRRKEGKTKQFEPARRLMVQPALSDVSLLGERVRRAEELVRTEDFVRRPEWTLCDRRWCPFYQGCVVTGELAGTVETVRARVSEM